MWEGKFVCGKENLCVGRKICVWEGKFVCGKENLCVGRKICVWEGKFVCGKENLCVGRKICVWEGKFVCGKENLCVGRKICVWEGKFVCGKENLCVGRKICVWEGKFVCGTENLCVGRKILQREEKLGMEKDVFFHDQIMHKVSPFHIIMAFKWLSVLHHSISMHNLYIYTVSKGGLHTKPCTNNFNAQFIYIQFQKTLWFTHKTLYKQFQCTIYIYIQFQKVVYTQNLVRTKIDIFNGEQLKC